MKTRNLAIICLFIIGSILFGAVNFVIIPRNKEKQKQYLLQQQDPTTQDLETILRYKSKYMGDSSNLINLFWSLPLNNIPTTYELFPDKLTADINYKESSENIKQSKLNKALLYNSTAAFALIDNLKAIDYNFKDTTYKIERSNVEKWYGEKLAGLLVKDKWKTKVQDKLKNSDYVNDFMKAAIKKQ